MPELSCFLFFFFPPAIFKGQNYAPFSKLVLYSWYLVWRVYFPAVQVREFSSSSLCVLVFFNDRDITIFYVILLAEHKEYKNCFNINWNTQHSRKFAQNGGDHLQLLFQAGHTNYQLV